jgi:hydrogenase nickel incorporation protein HypB
MKIKVVESVMKANDAVAAANRQRLEAAGLLAVNILSAPGSGKTTLLEKVILRLSPKLRSAVLVGDLQTTRDADRLGHLGIQVVQINTGAGCHLTATQVAQGLECLDLAGVDVLFIENVGNMVCPAAVDLGEHVRVAMLSLPEGDDKVAKYPTLFQPADIILLNKIDLAEVLDFDPARVRQDLARINTRAPLLEVSTRTGQGLEAFCQWVSERRASVTNG